MTTAVSAKAPRRSGKTTHLVHVPVIVGNQLLNRWTGSRSRSYGKMAGRDSADGNSPGGFLGRVARQMPLSLHNTATLPFSSRPVQSQRLFYNLFQPTPASFKCWPKRFSAFGHKSRREILIACPLARRALSTVEPPKENPARSACLGCGQP